MNHSYCPCCDPDTRDELVSSSQSTEVTVTEADKDAINLQPDTLPAAINSLQPVRRFPDYIQSRALIGRKSTRACAVRHVNNIFVSGTRACVVVVEGSRSVVGCCLDCKSCGCGVNMPRRRRTSPASSRDSDSGDSGSGGEAGMASSPMVGLPTGGTDEPSVPSMDVDTPAVVGALPLRPQGVSGRLFLGAAV